MAEFACKSVASVNELSVDYDAGTDSRAQCEHDKVFHAACYSVCHFAYCGSVGVVGDSNWYSKPVAEHLCQRDGALIAQTMFGAYSIVPL